MPRQNCSAAQSGHFFRNCDKNLQCVKLGPPCRKAVASLRSTLFVRLPNRSTATAPSPIVSSLSLGRRRAGIDLRNHKPFRRLAWSGPRWHFKGWVPDPARLNVGGQKELTMCDYSLENVASRPATVADRLVSTTFTGTFTRGFAGADDPSTAVCLRPSN